MRFNEKELKQLAGKHAIVEGKLQYMKPQSKDWSDWYQQPVYKERIFRLVQNFLFYYRTNEQDEPLGAFVLEHMEVAYESPGPAFAFSITFNDGKHIFACFCQDDLNKWVAALKVASFSYWQSLHEVLQVKLERLKGVRMLQNHNNYNIARHSEGNVTTSTTTTNSARHNDNADVTNVTMIAKRMSKSTFYSQSQVTSSRTEEEGIKSNIKAHKVAVVAVENLIDL